jgi:hypothetical protein
MAGGRADREPVALLDERVVDPGEQQLLPHARLDDREHAELVTPIRYARPIGATTSRSRLPSRSSRASPAGWPNLSL